jgi:hypothetical protein
MSDPVLSDQEYPADRNTRPSWVDDLPVPDPLSDYGGAWDGFQVTSDADPGL